MRWLARVFERIERFLFFAGLFQRVSNTLDGVLKAASPSYRDHRSGRLIRPTARLELMGPSHPAEAPQFPSPKRLELEPAPARPLASVSTLPREFPTVDELIDNEEDYEELIELFCEAYEREPFSDQELLEFLEYMNDPG